MLRLQTVLTFAMLVFPAGLVAAPRPPFEAPKRCAAVFFPDLTSGNWEVSQGTEEIFKDKNTDESSSRINIVATLQNSVARRVSHRFLTEWGPETSVLNLAVSRDGRHLAYCVEACGAMDEGCDYSAYLSTDGKRRRLRGLYWQQCGFSRDGKTLWMKTKRGFLALDVATRKIKWRWRNWVPQVSVSEGFEGEAGRFLLYRQSRTGKARFTTYDFRTRTVQSHIYDEATLFSGISPRGLWQYAAGRIDDKKKLKPLQTSLWMHSTRTRKVWQATITIQDPRTFNGRWDAMFSPDETLCAVHNGNRIEIFQTATGRLLCRLPAVPGRWFGTKISTDNTKIWTQTAAGYWMQRVS